MRFTVASSMIASVLLLCDQAQGQGLGDLLAMRFNIEGPDYEYGDLTFTMDFTVSDFMKDSMISYSLYDGLNCKDGGDNDITVNDGYLLSRIRTDSTPLGDGSGTRTIKVASEINPGQITNSPIYRDDEDGNAVIEYCVRFGVYNMPQGEANSFESNFIEVPVKLVINLTSGFDIDASVSNSDLVLKEASQNVAVEAYICDNEANNVPITGTEQGQTVRVCVSPTASNLAAGALMRQLEQFTFRREIPVSTSQVAIASDTGGVPNDQLTVVSCRPGSTVCAFETLLNADFFASEGKVIGSGQAFLQLGVTDSVAARRLEQTPNQILAEKPTSYSVVINLVPTDSTMRLVELSSAPTAATFMSVALVATSLALSVIGLF